MDIVPGGFDRDERGATPVVGIVLIVALAVVLAAVVGQAVFGYDIISTPSAAPAVSFSDSYDEPSRNLTVTHESGTSLDNGTWTFAVSGGEWDDVGNVTAPPGDLESGDEVVLRNIESDMTVRLIWEHPETGDSYVLYTWRGPEA